MKSQQRLKQTMQPIQLKLKDHFMKLNIWGSDVIIRAQKAPLLLAEVFFFFLCFHSSLFLGYFCLLWRFSFDMSYQDVAHEAIMLQLNVPLQNLIRFSMDLVVKYGRLKFILCCGSYNKYWYMKWWELWLWLRAGDGSNWRLC